MTSLAERLRARIAAEGPIGIDDYMAEANNHYYSTRDPLGVAGDFTTAPEISQMFGEMVGAALADCWLRAGAPDDAIFAELGPGRGTLAADALRVIRGAGFVGEVHLVETSPLLRAAQARLFPGATWHDRIDMLPARPLLLVANEFFDALSVCQWIGPEERRVTIVDDDFSFTADGPIREDSPARDAAAADLARHLARDGGVALIVDYGHDGAGAGDTLQAVRAHDYANPLADPGEQDITAHVDFAAFARAAGSVGASVSPLVSQGSWLERLGIAARAMALAATTPHRTAEIAAARRRLCDAAEMGELFKVIALRSPAWPEPAGFRA
ncbi:SAM-dependent methyltransferase [Sphingomonas sp.]|uniref:class I SAM-dependent methyltransferase n=1 Tax=Sphingomonas sp. TaxID=28214 RepID=UPI00286D0AA1|nr:SAM-dependent methyltransferase [Sphingomonas sp.]